MKPDKRRYFLFILFLSRIYCVEIGGKRETGTNTNTGTAPIPALKLSEMLLQWQRKKLKEMITKNHTNIFPSWMRQQEQWVKKCIVLSWHRNKTGEKMVNYNNRFVTQHIYCLHWREKIERRKRQGLETNLSSFFQANEIGEESISFGWIVLSLSEKNEPSREVWKKLEKGLG